MTMMTHPNWCTRRHPPERAVHEAQIGAELQLTRELGYVVALRQDHGEPGQVLIVRRNSDETTLTTLSIVEASILRDLLSEALQALALEVAL